jgi:hypothetical protein
MIRTTLTTLLVLLQLTAAAACQDGGGYDARRACAALSAMVDRGDLTVPAALRLLGSDREQEARAVAAVIRHEWAVLPEALFSGLDLDPRAARRLLEELARAPRPAALGWVRSQGLARPGRTFDHRLLALAARSEPLDRDAAKLLVESLKAESPGDGFYFACSYTPPEVADRLVGRMHAALARGEVAVDALTPLLDRLSRRGTKALVGLAVTLPPAVAHELLRHVHDTRPDLVRERLAAALDGRVPLEPSWLAFGAALIDRPARVERVLEVLRDGESERAREQAFEALLAAGAINEAVLEAAKAGDWGARVRRVIARGADHAPPAYVVRWLDSAPEIVTEMAQALARRPQLEPEVQQAVLDLLEDVEQADRLTPLYLVTAIVQRGDADALQQVWPLVRTSAAFRDLLDRLGRRSEPFVAERLRAWLAGEVGREVGPEQRERHQELLDMLRLQLVASGDRDELAALVRRAPARDAAFARRCRAHARELTAAQASALVEAAFASDDFEQAGELLEWAVTAKPAPTAASLWRFWQGDDARRPEREELLEVATRALMRSARRADLVAALRAAIAAGPLEERLSSLPYEALNSMPEPLGAADLRMCADLVLRAPLADRAGELAMARRWPDGTYGFPLVQAVASRLREADETAAKLVFAEVVDELRPLPEASSISRQRLKVFWRALARSPALQASLGQVTARLWSSTAPAEAVGEGAAAWLQARDAERRGELERAESLYRAAGRELLRLPERRADARWLLGERDPAGGVDPLAALAAAPHRMRLEAARAAGDRALERAAAALVLEFAGRDEATRATVNTADETGR